MIKKAIKDFCKLEVPLYIRTLFVNLLLIMASIFLISTVIEVCYRIYLQFNSPVAVTTPIGPRFIPNRRGLFEGGKTSIDKNGFRNGVDAKAWEKERKVMLLGDSVGFGLGIDDDQTISHQLNEAFNKSNIGFLNLCNPAWDTVLLRGRLYQYGLEFGPWDLVIWMYYINDAKHSVKYFPIDVKSVNKSRSSQKTQFWESFIFKWPLAMKKRFKKHVFSKKIKKDPNRSSWDNYYKWCLSSFEPGTLTRLNEKAFIRDIVQWTRKNSSEIVFVIFPAENQLADENRMPQDFIKSLGEEYNFPVIDLLPYLIEADKGEKVYLPGDHQHLNAYGSQIVSNIVKEWLINQTNLTNVTNKTKY